MTLKTSSDKELEVTRATIYHSRTARFRMQGEDVIKLDVTLKERLAAHALLRLDRSPVWEAIRLPIVGGLDIASWVPIPYGITHCDQLFQTRRSDGAMWVIYNDEPLSTIKERAPDAKSLGVYTTFGIERILAKGCRTEDVVFLIRNTEAVWLRNSHALNHAATITESEQQPYERYEVLIDPDVYFLLSVPQKKSSEFCAEWRNWVLRFNPNSRAFKRSKKVGQELRKLRTRSTTMPSDRYYLRAQWSRPKTLTIANVLWKGADHE